MIFAHHLAIKLGKEDVEGMLSRISMRQFIRWQAYYRLHPWGEERADVRAAIVASTVYYSAPRKKTAKRPQLKDFMPQVEGRRKPPEQQWELIKAYFTGMMGQNKK